MPERLGEMLFDARSVVVFTGAGISTGSGIPDFRGPTGIWKTQKPIYYQEFMASDDGKIAYWEYKLTGYEGFRDAKPNAAHLALVDMQNADRLDMLVTQNIDGLHHEAGNDPGRLIEIHGTNREIECLSCGERTPPGPHMDWFRENRKPPKCECGGYVKPATIMFGQSMPQAALEYAFQSAGQADLIITIGSTLEVHPAASVPLMALKNGANYCIINMGPTAQDKLATLRLEGDATDLLPRAVQALKALKDG